MKFKLIGETSWQTRQFVAKIVAIMEELALPRVELARRLKVRPSYITKLLGGRENLTVKTMEAMAAAVGYELILGLRRRPGNDLVADLAAVERRQLADQALNDARFQRIFRTLQAERQRVQGIFYDGQFWEATSLVAKLIGRARRRLVLIDSWVNSATLDLLAKKRPGVTVQLVTSPRGDKLTIAEIERFNAQFPSLVVTHNAGFHDRFLIVDERELYLIGASLKDLGSACFGFTKMDAREIPALLERLEKTRAVKSPPSRAVGERAK